MTEVFVRAMRTREAREMMPLDHAGVAVSLRYPGDVDLVASLENIGGTDRLPELQFAFTTLIELARRNSRRDLGLLKVASRGRSCPRKFPLAEGHLYGFITVGWRTFQLRNGARPELDHGHGLHPSRSVSNLSHSQLFSNQSS